MTSIPSFSSTTAMRLCTSACKYRVVIQAPVYVHVRDVLAISLVTDFVRLGSNARLL
jgi:hypothetical protein